MRALALAICALLPVRSPPLRRRTRPNVPARLAGGEGQHHRPQPGVRPGEGPAAAAPGPRHQLAPLRGSGRQHRPHHGGVPFPHRAGGRHCPGAELLCDLITPANILQKSIGQPVRVRQFLTGARAPDRRHPTLRRPGLGAGRPTARPGPAKPSLGIVVQGRDGVILLPRGQVEVPTLPPGLITRPALLWKVDAAAAASTPADLLPHRGVSWSSDYIARANEDDTRIDLTGG